jgi:hypothetical protein
MELVEQVKHSASAVRAAMADFQKVDAGLEKVDVKAGPEVSS